MIVLLLPVPLGLMAVVGLGLLRRSRDPTYRVGAGRWAVAIVIGIALSYVPLSCGDKQALGLPFPIAFSSQYGTFRELASLGPIALLSIAGNALFAREICWLAARGARAIKRRQ